MSNKLKLKRSAVPGRIPEPEALEYGEIALNYADGIIFFKDPNNEVRGISSGTPPNITDPYPQYTTILEAAAAAPVQSVVGTQDEVVVSHDASGVYAVSLSNKILRQDQPVSIGSILVENTLKLDTTSTTTDRQGFEYVIDEFSCSMFRTAKYVIQISSDIHYQSSEILLVHNNSDSFLTEYGFVQTNGPLASLDTRIVDNKVQLLAYTNYDNLHFQAIRQSIVI